MGRVLAENADQPFGDVINEIQKYVVSDSLQAAEWQNTEIVNGDVAAKLTDLKARDGGDIAMSGSATTVRWLLRQGLSDELNLLVHPIAVGEGLARLFPPDEPTVALKLLRSETFETGVLNLSYGPPRTDGGPHAPDRLGRRRAQLGEREPPPVVGLHPQDRHPPPRPPQVRADRRDAREAEPLHARG